MFPTMKFIIFQMKSGNSGICKVVDTQKIICPTKNVLVMIVMKKLVFLF